MQQGVLRKEKVRVLQLCGKCSVLCTCYARYIMGMGYKQGTSPPKTKNTKNIIILLDT
jgi:hypothetical protein